MTVTAVFVDAKAAVKTWVNAHPTLAGAGKPISLGAHHKRLRSPGTGCYAVLTQLPGSDTVYAQHARISASFYGMTSRAASDAAVAYANALRGLYVGNVLMGTAVCLTAGNISGPLELAEPGGESGFMVDADFIFVPAP
jgi:hypothetical protein